MTRTGKVQIDPVMAVVVLLVTVFAAAVRLSVPISSAAPLNDGGLFYSMIKDIQANHFLLPMFTTYNSAGIPFAYPPLALYLAAFLSSAFQISLFDLLRVLPPILSALCIPAFYLLARDMMDSKARVALSVIIFAFLPRTFDWPIMGGGITRSPGLFFALLAMRELYLLFARRSNASALRAILFGVLVVCTHPEAAVHTVIAGLVFYFLKDRSLKGLGRGAAIAAGVGVLSTPWWFTVISRYGLGGLTAPFTAAAQDSVSIPLRLLALFQFKFTDEPFIAILAVLGLIGIAALLARREYILPAWLGTALLMEPRGAPLYMMIPLSMMAAYSLDSVILPALRGGLTLKDAKQEHWARALLQGSAGCWALGFLALYLLISGLMVVFTLGQKYTLTSADLEAMQWVKTNTPPSATFVLITGENVLRDASSEWFPALAERRSLATIFGYEWVNDGRFSERQQAYNDLQSCADTDPGCLKEWSRKTEQQVDYVYIQKSVEGPHYPALAIYLSQSGLYEGLYDSPGVIIYHNTGK